MASVVNFNQDQDKDKQGQQPSQVGSPQGSSISPVNGTSAPAPNQPASSGKFTNIQNYIRANKGAGNQVASGVNQSLNKSLQPGLINQNDEADKFKAGAQSAQSTLDTGNKFNQVLSGPSATVNQINGSTPGSNVGVSQLGTEEKGAITTDPNANKQPQQSPGMTPPAVNPFNALDFVNNQDQLNQFTNIKTGNAIDETGLLNQAKTAQDLAAANQTTAQDLASQTQNQAGRFGLISSAFNRPNYTQGQKRLDNLFLTSGGEKGIEQIKNTANQNVAKTGYIYGQAVQGTQSAQDIGSQEKTLQSSLQTDADKLEQNYMDQLKANIDPTNAARKAEQDRWQNNFNILTGKQQGTIDSDVFKQLQLNNAEHSFNILNDPNLTLRQIANVSDKMANTAQDVASQKDADYYDALAKLKLGNLDANKNFTYDQSQKQIQGAGNLGDAVAAITGDNSLRSKLDTANKDFLDQALKTVLTAQGSDSGSNSIFGSGGDATATAQMDLGKYLKGLGLDSTTAAGARQGNASTNALMAGAAANSQVAGLVGDVAGAKAGLTPLTAPIDVALGSDNNVGSNIGNLMSNVGSGLSNLSGTITGANGGSQAAANQRAQHNLYDSLNNYLNKAGYNNYVTNTGNKDISNLTNQLSQGAQDRFDIASRNEYAGLSGGLDKYLSGAENNYINSLGKGQLGQQQLNDFNRGKELAQQGYKPNTDLSKGIFGEQSADDRAYGAYQDFVNNQTGLYNNRSAELQQKMNEGYASSNNQMDQIKKLLGVSDFSTPQYIPQQGRGK